MDLPLCLWALLGACGPEAYRWHLVPGSSVARASRVFPPVDVSPLRCSNALFCGDRLDPHSPRRSASRSAGCAARCVSCAVAELLVHRLVGAWRAMPWWSVALFRADQCDRQRHGDHHDEAERYPVLGLVEPLDQRVGLLGPALAAPAASAAIEVARRALDDARAGGQPVQHHDPAAHLRRPAAPFGDRRASDLAAVAVRPRVRKGSLAYARASAGSSGSASAVGAQASPASYTISSPMRISLSPA